MADEVAAYLYRSATGRLDEIEVFHFEQGVTHCALSPYLEGEAVFITRVGEVLVWQFDPQAANVQSAAADE